MIALSEPVQVALATGLLAGTIPAALGLIAAQRRAAVSDERASELTRKIGDPNGHENIVGMLTEVLQGQAGQDKRIAKLEAGQHAHTAHLTAIETDQRETRIRLALVESRIGIADVVDTESA